jgi:hypothetical protein
MRNLFGLLLVFAFLVGSGIKNVSAQDELPMDAQAIVVRANAKLLAAKQAYDDACTKIHAQEAKELLRVYDSLKGHAPTLAAAVKVAIDSLTAGKNVAAGAEAWIQGRWIVANKDASYRAIWEFKQGTVSTGESQGKWSIEGKDIQIVWANQVVDSLRVGEGDTTTGMGKAGPLTATRTKQ